MRTERTEPILPARNLDETRAFYEKLGFAPWFGGRGPWDYEIVSRGHLVVHFFAERQIALHLTHSGTVILLMLSAPAWGYMLFCST